MIYTRQLMDSSSKVLQEIGYKFWSSNGKLTPDELDEIAKLLTQGDMVNLADLEEECHSSYNLGYADGYRDGIAFSKEEAIDLAVSLDIITR